MWSFNWAAAILLLAALAGANGNAEEQFRSDESDIRFLQGTPVLSDVPTPLSQSDVPSTVILSDAPTPQFVGSDLPTRRSEFPSTLPTLLSSEIKSDIPSDISTDTNSREPSDATTSFTSSAPSAMPIATPSDFPTKLVPDTPAPTATFKPSGVPIDAPSLVPSPVGQTQAPLALSDTPSLAPQTFTEFPITTVAPTLPDLNTLLSSTPDLSIISGLFDLAGFVIPGNSTVFAPVNMSVENVALITKLQEPRWILQLEDFVAFQTVIGVFNSTVLLAGLSMTTNANFETITSSETIINVRKNVATRNLQGSAIKLTAASGNTSLVVRPDLEASDGLLFETDSLLLPFALSNNIIQVATANNLSVFVALVDLADLTSTLEEGNFTVLAPSNEAIAKLDPDVVDYLMDPVNIKDLQKVLLYHVISDLYPSSFLSNGTLETVEGRNVIVRVGSIITFNGIPVIQPNIAASNGIIHVVDAVLLDVLPLTPTPAPTPSPSISKSPAIITDAPVRSTRRPRRNRVEGNSDGLISQIVDAIFPGDN